MNPDKTDKHHLSGREQDAQELNIGNLVEKLAESAYLSKFFPIKQYKLFPGRRRDQLLNLLDTLAKKFVTPDYCEDFYDVRYFIFEYPNKEEGEFLILKAHHDAHGAITDHNLAKECTTTNTLNDAKEFLARHDYVDVDEDEGDILF